MRKPIAIEYVSLDGVTRAPGHGDEDPDGNFAYGRWTSGLAQALVRHQFVDEYRLMIHPVGLGTGKRLFREGTPTSTLRLVDAVTAASRLGTLIYESSSRGLG